MASEVRSFEQTIPPGTPKASPVTLDMSFDPMDVVTIHVSVPAGPNGNVGLQIASAGSQLIPLNQGEWLVPNNVEMEWSPTDAPNSGSWQLVAYNTGTYPHTVWVRFTVAPVAAAPAAVTASLIDPTALNSSTGSVSS